MAKKTTQIHTVSQDMIEHCLAKAIAQGDIVNFQFMFLPLSPLRDDNTEDIHQDKYAYLIPEESESSDKTYLEALGEVKRPDTKSFIQQQLKKKAGPPQLPASCVLLLADNAVRLGKYTSAAQAYELLRLRRRMQEEFYNQADAALSEGNIPKAVRGYRIATGLSYNYAAFPEPMPSVPNYQTKALLLHALYPQKPEDSVATLPLEQQLKTAMEYLLLDGEAASRLENLSQDVKLKFITELVSQIDPGWDEFRKRYQESQKIVKQLNELLQSRENNGKNPDNNNLTLMEEIQAQQAEVDFESIPELLLGRKIPNGEWWQYLKELAYVHPAAIFFVIRQFVSRDMEIILPPIIKGSPLVKALGLETL